MSHTNAIICDSCGASRIGDVSLDFERINTHVVVYKWADGWRRVPLAGTCIDLCPKCPVEKQNLPALARQIRRTR
jgi:hypothetical protein